MGKGKFREIETFCKSRLLCGLLHQLTGEDAQKSHSSSVRNEVWQPKVQIGVFPSFLPLTIYL